MGIFRAQGASAAPLAEPTKIIINTDKEKDLLIENYLPNLSNYQDVIKKIEIIDDKYQKKVKTYKLSPNVNFTNQKDYFIFYNDNLKILIELYKDKLKSYIKKHYVVLHFKIDNLNKIIKEIYFDLNADNSYAPSKLASNFIAYNWYQNIIEHANLLASNYNALTSVVRNYSERINENNFCSVTISKNLFDETVKLYSRNSEEKNCLTFIKEIQDIKEKQLDDIEKLELMNQKIDELKKIIKPENSIDNIKDFCFVINKISEYVRNFELALETKDYDLLKVIDSIRRN